MDRKRILVLSDSSKLHTGFGRVTKEIFSYLNKTGKYDISQVGWFHQDSNEDVTFPIYTTEKDAQGKITQEDKYAHKSFPGYVDKLKPDLVWSCGDSVSEDRIIPIKIDGQIVLKSFGDLWEHFLKYKDSQIQIGKDDNIQREFINLKELNILTLSHTGWERMEYISRHYYSGSLAYISQPKGHTICTFNHSVMIIDNGTIRKALPHETIEHELLNIELIENGIIGKHDTERDVVLARLCGAYVSEGSLSDTKCGKRVRISSTNMEWLKKLQDDVEFLYNKRGSIERSSRIDSGYCDCFNLVIWGIDIFNWFRDNCGRYSEGKKIPTFVLNGSERVVREFMRLAYEGDGYDGTEISYCTKSLQLASGISFLDKMLGNKNSIRYRDEKEAYTIRRIYKERKKTNSGYSVENVEYDGYVYDVTVKNSGTFVDALGCVVLHNTWMTDHIATSPNRKTFKWMAYFPIDGHPSPSKWGPVVENADVAVAYGKYGMEVIRQRAPKANLKYIYHGVNSNIFHPLTKEEKAQARKTIIGVEQDKIVIGIVARNQPRKAFDKLLEAYFYILNGAYIRCDKCGKITTFPYDIIKRDIYVLDKCKHCGSKSVKRGEPRDDVRLYIHGAIVDCGWDLLDLQNDYNLNGKLLVNPGLKIGAGVPDFTLNGVYNSFDIFTLPTRGEGFGLPILEAMSAGIPICVTDYSAYPEWASESGEMVPPAVMESEPLTNIRRAIIDMDSYVFSLLRLIDNPELREKYGRAGRKKALEMDWSIICKQWETLIDSVLYPDGNVPSKIDPTKITYTLENS